MDCVETERLLLRPFKDDDGPALHAVVGNDPDMTWDRSSRSLEKVQGTVRERMKHFATNGFGVWAVIDKSSHTLLGQCGLQRLPGTQNIELVVYTAKRFWRMNYAHEACIASLRYGFESLGATEILAVVRKENTAALNLMEKLGFKFLRDAKIYDADVKVFDMKRDEFKPGHEPYKVYPAS